MFNPYIILLSLFIADRRRHRQSSAVGYADSIVPGATTRVFRSAKDAVDFAADADMAGGTFQGEIEIVQDGYSISDDLAELAEVSTFETTKGGLRRALSALKKSRTTAIGATHSKEWIIDYISHRLDVYDRQLPKLIDKNAIERNVAVQEELHSILKHIYF